LSEREELNNTYAPGENIVLRKCVRNWKISPGGRVKGTSATHEAEKHVPIQ
jgi:hypothetical protein